MKYQIFPGNPVVINRPSVFGQYMHNSKIHHHKILRHSCRTCKGPGAWSLNCKDRAKLCLLQIQLFNGSLEDAEFFCGGKINTSFISGRRYLRHCVWTLCVYGLCLVKWERGFEGMLWQTFLILHSVLGFQNGLFSMGLFIYLSGRLDSSLLECQALWRDK